MTIEEIGVLLVHAQAIDNRQIEEITILEWHADLADLDLATSVEALRLHRRESDKWVQPVHIRRGVERIRVAGLGVLYDDWGNELAPDVPAIAAHERLAVTRQAVTS